jgi:hypothetical protein
LNYRLTFKDDDVQELMTADLRDGEIGIITEEAHSCYAHPFMRVSNGGCDDWWIDLYDPTDYVYTADPKLSMRKLKKGEKIVIEGNGNA